jgi:ATP-dependent Clp protease ATP-binding subunit ClpA
MLNREVEFGLGMLVRDAREQHQEFLSVEHLLMMLTDMSGPAKILRAIGADLDVLRDRLQKHIDEHTPRFADTDPRDPQPTLGFQRVLQRAIFQAQSAGRSEVEPDNLLIATFSEQESHAVFFLAEQNISRLDVVSFIAHGEEELRAEVEAAPTDVEDAESPSEDAKESALQRYAQNLNRMARDGVIDPLIGREREVERVLQILMRRRKNNPLLVGEAGVGKTAIAEGLARRIVEGDVPEPVANTTIWSLDLGGLLAGTKYRGDFEKRLKGVLQDLEKDPDAVLFIDEIHTIIGAGAASGSSMDASNLIKPRLASGQLRCIGSTTWQEFRAIFEKDHALARRFQKVDVEEPSVADTIRILEGLRTRLEEHHDVRFTKPALQSAAELSERYIHDRQLPDKAIDVLDEAGARNRLRGHKRRTVGVKDIEEVVASIAKVPARTVNSDDRDRLQTLDRDLRMVVFGQDPAIETLVSAIRLSRSGLGSDDRPVGSFLFAGPTGVGKTEICRQLARQMGVELVRFDMSEYMERHTVSRLIGAPPGYVGYEEGGLLTDAIHQNPHAVLLLDEIEKAHPDVFNLLLQVMDHGSLTDSNGRRTDFRDVILILTTNAGAEHTSRASIGFAAQDHTMDAMGEIKRLFSPEFRNRLDAIVQFAALGPEQIAHVVEKFLAELESQLHARKVDLQVDDEARTWLAEHGYDQAMGARPMRRLIQDQLRRPLADALLFGNLKDGGVVTVGVADDQLTLHTEPRKARGAQIESSELESA